MLPNRFVVTTLVTIAGLAALPAAFAQDVATSSRLYRIVNATSASATAIAMAPAGSAAFVDLPMGEALQGGLSDATVRIPAGECLRDMRVTFGNGSVARLEGIDVCRGNGLRLGSQRGLPATHSSSLALR